MQQLSGLDNSFLHLETPAVYGHVSSLAIFEPGERSLQFDEVRALIQERLHLVAPFRRRLVGVPLSIDHPYWIEDPDFDLDYHLRHIAVPPPGDERQLAELAARAQRQAPRPPAPAVGDVHHRRARRRRGGRAHEDPPRLHRRRVGRRDPRRAARPHARAAAGSRRPTSRGGPRPSRRSGRCWVAGSPGSCHDPASASASRAARCRGSAQSRGTSRSRCRRCAGRGSSSRPPARARPAHRSTG